MSLDIQLCLTSVDINGDVVSTTVFETNITHNLAKMADYAGLYKVMWRPGEIDVSSARDAIKILEAGIEKLESSPDHFKQYNPANGWGTYEILLETAKEYLKFCAMYPDAIISVWR